MESMESNQTGPMVETRAEDYSLSEEYKPSSQEALGRYEINIQFLSRGCIIRVGCKSIPFSSTEEAIAELKRYFDNPYETQEEWNKKLY